MAVLVVALVTIFAVWPALEPGVVAGSAETPDNLPRKTFVPVPCEPTVDLSPWPCGGGSKHQRWAADGKGSVWTGFGDTNPTRQSSATSQNQGFRLDLATRKWTRWNPACRPTGQIMPSYPDELPWAYDQRGAFWLFPGVLQGSDGVICDSGTGERGATLYKTGLFRYRVAEDRWDRFTDGQALPGVNALWGHFDNTTKSLMWWSDGGCGSQFTMLNVDTRQRTSRDLCLSTNPYPGTPYGTFESAADGRITHWAWDEAGRTVYVVAVHTLFVGQAPAGQSIRAWAYNVDTGRVTRLPDPPNALLGGRVTDPDAQLIAWDSRNKRLLYPWSRTHCGELEAMYTYDPGAKAWESHPLTLTAPVPNKSVPRGNSAVYDPFHGVLVLGGTYACADWGYPGHGAITHYFLWRF